MEHAIEAARAAVAGTVERLRAAGAPTEFLARTRPARRALGIIPRPATMERFGEGWRLGALVLTTDGRVFATGRVFRADRAVRPGQQAASAQERRDLRLAALRAGFPDGAAVDLDPEPIPLDEPARLRDGGTVVLRGDRLLVRWMPGAGDDALAPFERYLAERADLVLESLG